MANSAMVFIGMQGHVVALDRATGAEVWRSKVKGEFVNVVLLGGDLYAAANGELCCLDATTGHIRWRNELKGLGFGLISIAGGDSGQTVTVRQIEQQAANTVAP